MRGAIAAIGVTALFLLTSTRTGRVGVLSADCRQREAQGEGRHLPPEPG